MAVKLPPLPELVQVQAHSTEPGLFVTAEGVQVRLRGAAQAGDGEVTLCFDGARVSVAAPAGTQAHEVGHLFAHVMPFGYRVSVEPTSAGDVLVEVVRRPLAPPPQTEDGARSATAA